MSQNFSIWLVDDDPDELFLVSKALRRLEPNVTIRTFEDPCEVLDAFHKQRLQGQLPDLLVTDVNMPQMSGPSLLKLLADSCPDISCGCNTRFILCSTALPLDVKQFMAQIPNLHLFITKPDLPQDFATLLLTTAAK